MNKKLKIPRVARLNLGKERKGKMVLRAETGGKLSRMLDDKTAF